MLIYSIVGFGFTYLLGYAGLASLGTAGFTGLGAYIVGYFLRETGVPYIVSVGICTWGVEKGIISQSIADSYMISAYAMSSFIALEVFMEGINRLADKEITREAFLEAMESAPINVPISGGVNYANGQRIGLDGMSFVKYVRPTEAGAAASTGTFVNVIGMQSIDQILGELGDAE